MTARAMTYELLHRLPENATFDDAHTLRRAEKTLHRWAERECGSANGAYIRRDEDTGETWEVTWDPITGAGMDRRIPDLESGALRRVKAVCGARGWHYYSQGDPRGCALYVSTEPLTDQNYTDGISCCVRGS